MCKRLPNDTSVDSYLVPTSRDLLLLIKVLIKSKNFSEYFYYFFLKKLRVYYKRLALAITIDVHHLAKVL